MAGVRAAVAALPERQRPRSSCRARSTTLEQALGPPATADPAPVFLE